MGNRIHIAYPWGLLPGGQWLDHYPDTLPSMYCNARVVNKIRCSDVNTTLVAPVMATRATCRIQTETLSN